ncbi:MAG: class F sortase [Candidatus Microsaccharimonas sp.]
MLDNQTPSSNRDFGRRPEIHYRPDEAALYARRIVDLPSTERRGVVTPVASAPIAAQAPVTTPIVSAPVKLVIAPQPVQPIEPVVVTSVAPVAPIAPPPAPVVAPAPSVSLEPITTPAVAVTPVATPPVAPPVPLGRMMPVPSATAQTMPSRSSQPVVAPLPAVRPQPIRPSTTAPTSSIDGMFVRKPVAEAVAPVVSPAATVPAVEKPVVAATPVKPTKSKKEKHLSKHVKKEKADKKEKKPRRKGLFHFGGAAVAAMLVMAVTGYVSIDTFVTNSEVKQVVAKQSSNAQTTIMAEGEDESDVKESTVDKYKVAGDLPRVLTIDSINVKARVLPMSVNADGAMQAPVNIFDSGWYGASAKPGQKGAMFINGHASGASRKGLFAYLDTMKVGDTVSIEKGDGQKLSYKVVHAETIPKDETDMAKALRPYGKATEGLNLMTCTGTWIADQKTYDHRVLVYTERI